MIHRLFAPYAPYALSIVRLLVGITFTLHGSQKVFGFFGGSGLEGFANYISSAFKFPGILGYIAAFIEFGGGILLILGLFTQYAALAIMPVMLVAFFGVHFKNGYFAQNGGFEYVLNLLVLLFVLIIGNSDKLSIMNVIR